MKRLSSIFEEKPEYWGLRGDSYFWNYLEEKFSNYRLPFEYEELEKIIKEEYLKLTGDKLTNDSIGRCDELEHGGMSSGAISGEFWISIALPLLKERLKNYNKKNYR